MIYRYPPEVHEFVKVHAPGMRDQDLAEACNRKLGTNFTNKSMKAFRSNYGYKNGLGKWTSEEYWKYQTRYPKGLYEFVRDNSWGVSSKEMAEMVNEKFGTNFTQGQMKEFRQRNGIRSGLTGWFQKGRAPGNKGKKQREYCTPEAIERSKATQFKKGNRPKNELPVGTILTDAEGYLIRKKQMEGTCARDRWEYIHRAEWEKHNGPIPEGMVIMFKDSDKTNCDISNLELITRGEHLALSRMHLRFENPELTEAGLNVVRLYKKAGAIKKERRKRGQEKGDHKDNRKHDRETVGV